MTNFVNHHYLFALLSTLMAAFCNARAPSTRRAWLLALRWQVATVYFFASLWKCHRDWVDGTIVRGIFLSFEEQGVARDVPWAMLEKTIPHLFPCVAVTGLLLDASLCAVLALARPGSTKQWVGLVFHAFTGFTMSQRIGYAFPVTMIASALAFQPADVGGRRKDDTALVFLLCPEWLRRRHGGGGGEQAARAVAVPATKARLLKTASAAKDLEAIVAKGGKVTTDVKDSKEVEDSEATTFEAATAAKAPETKEAKDVKDSEEPYIMDFDDVGTSSTNESTGGGALGNVAGLNPHKSSVVTNQADDACMRDSTTTMSSSITTSASTSTSTTTSSSTSRCSKIPPLGVMLATLWIVFQCLFPLRMPIISGMEFPQTSEGYRFSWTMMLHSKHSEVAHGVPLFSFSLYCGAIPFREERTEENPHWDPRGVPNSLLGERGMAAATMFPRQLPRITKGLANILPDGFCASLHERPGMGGGRFGKTTKKKKKLTKKETAYNNRLRMHMTMFSSINDGPFVRLIDPTVDLLAVHRAKQNLPYLTKLWLALVDKPPTPAHEFILRGATLLKVESQTSHWVKDEKGVRLGGGAKPGAGAGSSDDDDDGDDDDDDDAGGVAATNDGTGDTPPKWITIVDRTPCLRADPLRFLNLPIVLRVERSPVQLEMHGCKDVHEKNCDEKHPLVVGRLYPILPTRVFFVSVSAAVGRTAGGKLSAAGGGAGVSLNCSSAREDVVVQFRALRSIEEAEKLTGVLRRQMMADRSAQGQGGGTRGMRPPPRNRGVKKVVNKEEEEVKPKPTPTQKKKKKKKTRVKKKKKKKRRRRRRVKRMKEEEAL